MAMSSSEARHFFRIADEKALNPGCCGNTVPTTATSAIVFCRFFQSKTSFSAFNVFNKFLQRRVGSPAVIPGQDSAKLGILVLYGLHGIANRSPEVSSLRQLQQVGVPHGSSGHASLSDMHVKWTLHLVASFITWRFCVEVRPLSSGGVFLT